MFDLEHSLGKWRRQMLAAGIKTPALLEELEGHLREEFGRQLEMGVAAGAAFALAVKTVGPAPELRKEFKKVDEPIGARLMELMSVACGTVALLFSLWILYAALFLIGVAWPVKVLSLTAVAVTIVGWKYNHKILPAFRHSWIRALIGCACCLACLFLARFFIATLVPRFAGNLELVGKFLWGWTLVALLGTIGHGLVKAARAR
jgi:hypothetical protein